MGVCWGVFRDVFGVSAEGLTCRISDQEVSYLSSINLRMVFLCISSTSSGREGGGVDLEGRMVTPQPLGLTVLASTFGEKCASTALYRHF